MNKGKITIRVTFREVNRWQTARIKEGLRQADAGKFATDREVASAFARWRKPSGPSADIQL